MKNNKIRTPRLPSAREQLASLRIKQERHERLAQQHADSAKRLWLRRVLLELSQEEEKRKRKRKRKGKRMAHTGVQRRVGRPGHAAK